MNHATLTSQDGCSLILRVTQPPNPKRSRAKKYDRVVELVDGLGQAFSGFTLRVPKGKPPEVWDGKSGPYAYAFGLAATDIAVLNEGLTQIIPEGVVDPKPHDWISPDLISPLSVPSPPGRIASDPEPEAFRFGYERVGIWRIRLHLIGADNRVRVHQEFDKGSWELFQGFRVCDIAEAMENRPDGFYAVEPILTPVAPLGHHTLPRWWVHAPMPESLHIRLRREHWGGHLPETVLYVSRQQDDGTWTTWFMMRAQGPSCSRWGFRHESLAALADGEHIITGDRPVLPAIPDLPVGKERRYTSYVIRPGRDATQAIETPESAAPINAPLPGAGDLSKELVASARGADEPDLKPAAESVPIVVEEDWKQGGASPALMGLAEILSTDLKGCIAARGVDLVGAVRPTSPPPPASSPGSRFAPDLADESLPPHPRPTCCRPPIVGPTCVAARPPP